MIIFLLIIISCLFVSYKLLNECSCRYFLPLKLLMTFVVPTILSVYVWNNSWYNAIGLHCFMRILLILNYTWSINSVAHLWGSRPYDR